MFSLLMPKRETIYQFFYVFLVGLLILGLGSGLSYSAVSLPYLRNSTAEPSLNTETAGLFASMRNIITPIGCIASIFLTRLGRRTILLLGSIIDMMGWILIASSYSVTQILIGRAINGFANGLLAVPFHIYIQEIITARESRILNSSTSLFFSLGGLIIYFFGYIFEKWQFMAVGVLSVEFFSVLVASCFLPESPYWLLLNGRENDARKALLLLRGLKKPTPSFEAEFSDINSHIQSQISLQNTREVQETLEKNSSCISKITRNVFGIFKKPEVWKPFVILNVFFSFQTFSGLAILDVYTVDIVRNLGITINPFLTTIYIGVVQTIATIFLMTCSFRIGRRKAAIISSTIVSVNYIVLGIYKQYFENTHLFSIPLTCLLIIAIMGTVGILCLPWTMLSELYPTKYIHILGPLTICINSLTHFIGIYFFETLAEQHFLLTIYIFCGCTAICTLFLFLALPESSGVSKINIENQFRK